MEKKLVLPGDYLSSAEEAEPGENTYSEQDEVYSAAVGENISSPGNAAVKSRGRNLKLPAVGMPVYCFIVKTSANKAIAGCISVEEAEGSARGVQMDAVLPVTAIRSSYVRDIRDEVKIGDIIRARVEKFTKTGADISMAGRDCGVVCAFCPRCRNRMGLKERIFVCNSCGWKERRKIPIAEGEESPGDQESGYSEHRESGWRSGRYGGQERREYTRREYGGRGPSPYGSRDHDNQSSGDRRGFRRYPPRRREGSY